MRRDRGMLLLQIGGAVALFVALAAAPPARGAILLLPVGARPDLARLALARDVAILGTGPAGSVVVRGERRALFWPMLRHGVLTLAAPPIVCGEVA